MILNEIIDKTVKRVSAVKAAKPLNSLISECDLVEGREPFIFEKSLKKERLTYICEVKKASPSKGIIDPFFDYINIAQEYENAGADAVSVLTEPYYFLGNDEYLTQISRKINLPVIRKDFIIDEYQIYEAKVIHADAVLLICSVLDIGTLKRYMQLADSLGLSALVETHCQQEIEMALQAGARVIGVNNRNLNDFTTDINHALALRELIPKDIVFVSESGISCADDISKVKKAGADCVLIGEALMKSADRKKMLQSFYNA